MAASAFPFGERKFHTSASELESGDWILLQKKTFTNWCNSYLKLRKEKITDLYQDFRSGVKLIHLLEMLSRDKMPRRYQEEPKMEIHCKENLKTAFDFMRAKGLPLDIIGGDDIAAGNEKLTLGLVWTIIVFFQVDDIQLDGVSGKDGLMLWCQRQCPHLEIKDFSRSWKNGIAFCSIIHRYRPDAFDLASLESRPSRENIELALATAEAEFGVDRLFDPEDVALAEKPDEKVVLTYLAMIFRALAKYTMASGLVNAIKKAMAITRRHESWISQYIALAEELKSLISQTAAAYSTNDFGTSTSNIKAALDAFYEYKRDTKPQYQAILASLQGLFATLTASSKSNNRPPWVAPDGLSLAALAEDWKKLETAEDAYEHGVRREHALFSTLDNLLGRFAVRLTKITTWMAARGELFAVAKLGHTRLEVETLLEAHTAFEHQAVQYGAAIDTLEVWANTPGMEKHEEQANCLAHVAHARQTMTELLAAAAAYQAKLLAMKSKYEQLQACNKFAVWLEAKLVIFRSGVHGDSLIASQELLKVLQEEFTDALPKWKLMISPTTASSEEDVLARVAEVTGMLATVEAAAAEYKAACELSVQKFKQIFLCQKVIGFVEQQLEVFTSGKYGTSWESTKITMDNFEEYKAALEEHKEILKMDVVSPEVKPYLDAAAASLQQCEATAAQYYENLLTTMDHHKHGINLAKDYNNKATEFIFAADDLEEDVEQPLLYQSVAEVQASIESLDTKLRTNMNALTTRFNEISAVAEQIHQVGNTEEAFSRYTVQALFDRHEAISAKLAARHEALQQSLAVEQTKEQLRIQFAEKAAAFKAHCDSRSAQITALEGDLESRIIAIQRLHGEYCGEIGMLEELQVVSNTLEEWGIINNSHTPETILSLRAVWDVLGKTYERMYEALRNQYLAEKSGQITPEQYQEIMDVMLYFDKDKDKCLNELEFRNCITGLGLVVSDETIAAKLATSPEKKLNFDEFAGFMVEMLSEPGHTLAEVVAAFKELADGRPTIPSVVLQSHFIEDEDRAYLMSNMTATSPGLYDYESFCTQLFSK